MSRIYKKMYARVPGIWPPPGNQKSTATQTTERKEKHMGVTMKFKDKNGRATTVKTARVSELGKSREGKKDEPARVVTITSSGWDGRAAGARFNGRQDRGRELLAAIHGVLAEKVQRERALREQDWSMLSKEEAARQQRAARTAINNEAAVKLDALHADLRDHRTLVMSRITKSKYPGIFSKSEADRAGDAAERNAGIALANLAGSLQRATQTLRKLRADHRISAANQFLEALEARGKFSDSDSVEMAAAFQHEVKTFKEEVGVAYFEGELATIEKGAAFIKSIVPIDEEGNVIVGAEGVTVNASPLKMMELGLIAQVGEQDPGKTDPDTLAGAVREERAIDDELEELRAQGDPDAPPTPEEIAEAARTMSPEAAAAVRAAEAARAAKQQ